MVIHIHYFDQKKLQVIKGEKTKKYFVLGIYTVFKIYLEYRTTIPPLFMLAVDGSIYHWHNRLHFHVMSICV